MNKRNKTNLIVLIVLLVAAPVLLYLVTHPQIFRPKAGGGTIEVFGDNIINLPNGQKGFTVNAQGQPVINIRLTSPFGPPGQTGNNQQVNTIPIPINQGVSLQLSPSSGNQTVGSSFDVGISLNSGGNNISFVDLNIVSDKILTIGSFTPSGTFKTLVVNGPPQGGTYRFVAGNSSTQVISGNINIGTIHFITNSTGTANASVTAKEVTVGGASPVDIQATSATGTYNIK